MKAFLITLCILWALEVWGRFYWLSKSELPPRTRGAYVIDTVICIILLAWAAALLVDYKGG